MIQFKLKCPNCGADVTLRTSIWFQGDDCPCADCDAAWSLRTEASLVVCHDGCSKYRAWIDATKTRVQATLAAQ